MPYGKRDARRVAGSGRAGAAAGLFGAQARVVASLFGSVPISGTGQAESEHLPIVHGVQPPVVRQRLREPLHAGEAIHLDQNARSGRAHAELGASELPIEQSGFSRRFARRLRRQLADQL